MLMSCKIRDSGSIILNRLYSIESSIEDQQPDTEEKRIRTDLNRRILEEKYSVHNISLIITLSIYDGI